MPFKTPTPYLLILASLCLASTLHAEPSAFELQSGATKSELRTLKTSSKQVNDALITFQTRLDALKESIAGYKSVVEGTAVSNRSLREKTTRLTLEARLLKERLDALTKEFDTLKGQNANNKAALASLEGRFNKLSSFVQESNKGIMAELGNITKLINSQSELLNKASGNKASGKKPSKHAPTKPTPTKAKSKNQNTPKAKHSREEEDSDDRLKLLKIKKKDTSKDTRAKSGEEPLRLDSFSHEAKDYNKVYKEALALYRKKSYARAKERFDYLADAKYRKATSSYYLGQIAYALHHYKSAIYYYKRSVMLDDKAVYMPSLLWHTADSFYHIGDTKNYRRFLDSLYYLYPESSEARKAKSIQKKRS